jgi:hypothetical protein
MPKLNRRPESVRKKEIIKNNFVNEEDSNESNTKIDENKKHLLLITSFGPKVCFVCDEQIKKGGIYVGKHALNGNDMYRHSKCCSGSENWTKKFHGHVYQHIKN